MMDLNMDIEFEPSFYKKVNHHVISECGFQTIKKTTLEAEKRCKVQAPGPGNQLPGTTYKAIGRLRRSHSSKVSQDEGLVTNSTKYWRYVVYGTSKMPARNYPQKIANALISEQYILRTMLTELRRKGVIE